MLLFMIELNKFTYCLLTKWTRPVKTSQRNEIQLEIQSSVARWRKDRAA